jgi:hypothetical protein
MLLAPRIAPITFREIGEQNLVFLSKYCSRDIGYPLITPKDGKRGIFQSFIAKIDRRN